MSATLDRLLLWLDKSTNHGCEMRKHSDGVHVVLTDSSGIVGSASATWDLAANAALDMASSELPGVLRLRASRLSVRAQIASREESSLRRSADSLTVRAGELERQAAADAIAGKKGR